MTNLVIVTASLDLDKSAPFIDSWIKTSDAFWPLTQIIGTFGVVPAFLTGIKQIIKNLKADNADLDDSIIACFHDDLKIYEKGWDTRVKKMFDSNPKCGLVGFGGAYGIGTEDIYKVPYSPNQLARQDFISNLKDAENHGRRVLTPEKVACFDGAFQIGRAANMLKWYEELSKLRVVHHFYDGLLGGMCFRDGLEAWYLPISCFHNGGMTATASAYLEWANKTIKEGDLGYWKESHSIGHAWGKGIFPIRIPRGER